MSIDKSDSNLLIYYYFDSVPVSGLLLTGPDIVNQAINAPANTDLSWYSTWNTNGIPGVNGLYGVDLTLDGIDSSIPPQWGGRNMFAASGFTNNAFTNLSSHHKWRNIADWTSNAISNALATGDFSFGGWFKVSSVSNDTTNYSKIVHFAANTGNFSYGFDLRFNPNAGKNFYCDKYINGIKASIGTSAVSGTFGDGDGRWSKWNHVVCTISRTADGGGDYAHIYLNGVLDDATGSPDDAEWADDFTALNIPRYLSINGIVWDYAPYQACSAFRDFFFFDRILTAAEVQEIFNNDIDKSITFYSNYNNLKLWYRFSEPSGVNIDSWATNTPTGLLYNVEKAIPLDVTLDWYNVPANGIEGVYSIDASESGQHFPAIWNNNPDRTICASGNTTTLYHALRGENIYLSEIADILASGSFTVGCWFNYETLFGASSKYVFSFDRGSADDLCLGLNNYSSSLIRFVFNNGVGSNHYLYNNLKDSNAYGWNHVVITHTNGGSDGKYGRFYINGQLGGETADTELDSLYPPYYLTIFNNHDEWSDGQHQGAIKDFVLFDRELNAEEAEFLYSNGIILLTTTSSGVAGGYVAGRSQTSGIIGGYANGWAYEASGILGGYGYGRWIASGICGGYVFCGSRTYDSVGGFIYCSGMASGILGGYTYSVNRVSGILGGYNFSVVRESGIIGGFVNCGLQGSGVIDSSFKIKAITYSDFDSLAHIYASNSSDFDAQATVFTAERSPFVSIKYPDGIGLAEGHDVSGVLAPLLIWFVGSGVPVDSKTVDKAIYNFGDLSAQVFGTASGVDEYVTTHNYVTSGIYVATLKVTDSDGMIGSDYARINLASGVPMPNVSLTANPTIGYAPLSVDFDYTISNIPNGVTIVSKVLLFGNGQSSVNPNITYIYDEPGQYIPILIVKDSRGFYTSDSIEIGVNN